MAQWLLGDGYCLARPVRLEPGTTVLYGRDRTTGRCPCCGTVWLTDETGGWVCLDAGRLTKRESAR
ncbi:MAG TPA: hypothetical protein VLZ05_24185 [Mycobacterium sp.]|nr:hypothetical protein [Mycobacterium sp.]HUH71702.1 hypothetical protein [Mycobacterium sp.]